MRKNKSKAFTLVELMIVISIIGVLAVTLLPKLQGAQARSRDAGRIASVTSVEAVLNTYFTDEGQYPRNPSSTAGTPSQAINDTNGNGCLSSNNGTINYKIASLFKGSKAPLDPHKNNKAAYCGVGGPIGYHSLTKDGIADNSYMLITNVESYQKANYDLNSTAIPVDGSAPYDGVKGTVYGTWGKLAAESTNGALNSVYAIIN